MLSPPVNRSLYRSCRVGPNAGFAEEPLLEVVDEVREPVPIGRLAATEHDGLTNRGAILRGLDQPLIAHQAKHDVASAVRALGVHEGIEVVGGGDQTGEQRRLSETQRAGVDREVRLGGRLHPVGPLAEVDGVQVLREDLVLRQAILELPGERRLVELAPERVGVADVEVLHQLLGDRGSALRDLALVRVDDGGPGDRPDVDAVMGEEAAILDRDRCVSDERRHLALAQDDPVLGGVQLGDQRTVGGVQERGLREGQRVVLVDARQVACRRGDGEQRDQAEQGEASAVEHRGRV